MQYYFSGKASREFSKLPRSVQLQIMGKLEIYISAPDPLHFAERLTDFAFGEYRFRIGDYRVIFDVDGGTVVILKVGHRKDIYK